MNKSRTKFLILFVFVTLFATACSGVSASSWPGISVANDVAYVSNASFVLAIKTSDGSLMWQYPAKAASGQSFYATPVLTPDGSQLIVGDYTTNLYSLDPTNGTMIWDFSSVKGRWVGSVLIVGNTIYAPCADNNLYALDLQGNLLWKFSTNAAIWAQPVTDGKTIFVASMDHWIYAVNPSDGTLIWKADTGGALVTAPLLDSSGILYVGTLANEMVAVQSSNGQILWKTPTDGAIWSTPVMHGGNLYFGDLTGAIYSVASSDGKIVWQQSTGSSISGSMALLPDGLVYGNEAGSLTAIDFNGKTLWPKVFNGKLYSNLIYSSNLIFIPISGSSDTLLVALDASGNQKWTLAPPK
jgi:outer membrane protein assembly factor BamB